MQQEKEKGGGMAAGKNTAVEKEKAAINAEIESIDKQLNASRGAESAVIVDQGRVRSLEFLSASLKSLADVTEREPEWLIPNYIPRYQITSLFGDGGSGKTSVWCDLAAAVSNGTSSLMSAGCPQDFIKREPQKVVFFSSEDSAEFVLKRRLGKNDACMENIFTIDIADEHFERVKFNDPFLEQILAEYRPALCIFDPIQAFVPANIKMGDRNAMRSCLSPLIGYGEKYGTTFLIIGHSNKQAGVWGRKRMADSSDVWDISRSVILVGETNEKGIRYLSHEKSNYGMTGETILYTIEDGTVRYKGETRKKDKDFVMEANYTNKIAPAKAEAREFILDFLKDGGEKEVSELDGMAEAMGISKNSLKNAKAALRAEGKAKTWSIGYGENKKFLIRLLDGGPAHTEKTNE